MPDLKDARLWAADGYPSSPSLRQVAESIVAWINDNGGEARYEPSASFIGMLNSPKLSSGPVIAVRIRDGWAYATPGYYFVLGDTTFRVSGKNEFGYGSVQSKPIREVYRIDPYSYMMLTSGYVSTIYEDRENGNVSQ